MNNHPNTSERPCTCPQHWAEYVQTRPYQDTDRYYREQERND